MQTGKLTGPEAPSQKYDLIAALGSHALAAEPAIQRLALRFITLVTARYNWRRGQLSVGQREIARLWSVDERTVKREMARLRELGWIVQQSQGRRGRVASYGLDLTAIRLATREGWARVGPDFEARLAGGAAPAGATVVPFPAGGRDAAEAEAEMETPAAAAPGWDTARRRLQDEDPAIFASWFAPLRSQPGAGEGITLVAPTAFDAAYIRTHYLDRLLRALRASGGAAELRLIAAAEAPRPEEGREARQAQSGLGYARAAPAALET